MGAKFHVQAVHEIVPLVTLFCVIVFCYNGWPAKIGFMPF